jgi:hypothetical protein
VVNARFELVDFKENGDSFIGAFGLYGRIAAYYFRLRKVERIGVPGAGFEGFLDVYFGLIGGTLLQFDLEGERIAFGMVQTKVYFFGGI